MKIIKCIFLLFWAVQANVFSQSACDAIDAALLRIDKLVVDGKLEQALTALKKIKNDPDVRNCEQMKVVEYKIKDIESKMLQTADKMFEQGEDYFLGRNGKSKDYAKAVEWYNKAAEQGNADAMIRLAECYEEGYGVAKSERKGVEYEKKAAALGNAKAQFWLGNTYTNESYGGETRNYAEALKWYRKSAEQGYAGGQYGLGNMYRNGYGVSKDYTEAVKWYLKAAEQGYASGQNQLGNMYLDGYGVSKDYAEALKWYRKAAEQGNASGQSNLGYMCYYGYGVSQDYAEALKWYRKAAEQGNAISQFNLGFMYENGYGVTKNLTEAKKWYEKAAAQGYENAKKKLKENIWNLVNVTGVVYDEDREPLIGTTIFIKNTKDGVISDIYGKFSISVALGTELEFSYVGYNKVTVKVVDDKPINVYMKPTRR